MRIRNALAHSMLLAPGVVDASLASLAGFITTLYAAKFLEPSELGVYALYFSGFLLTGLIPIQTYFVPVEIASLELPLRERVGVLRPSVLGGLLFCAAAAMVAPLPGIIALGHVEDSVILALAISNAALVFASPLQDHVRLMHHYCERPFRAVAMSGTQLLVVVSAIAAMHVADLPPAWIPFGSLAIANVCSTTLGLLTMRAEPGTPPPRLAPLRTVIRLGGVLVVAEVLLAAAALASDALVLLLVSAEVLGFAAAAAAVARPVVVLSLGLGRFFAQRAMTAGMSGSQEDARRLGVRYAGALAAFAAAYLVAFGWPHPLNPMEKLVPVAYEVSGLVITLSIGLTIQRSAHLPLWLLLGARRSRKILYIAFGTSVARLAGVAALAPLIGAHASAAGFLIEGTVRGGAGWRASGAMFDERER